MDKGSNQDEMKYYVKCKDGEKEFDSLQDAWKYYSKIKDFFNDRTAQIWDENGVKWSI